MGQAADERSDVYAVGILLYQLLTGEKPFDGSLTSIMHKALNTRPPRPSALSLNVPPGLDGVVERAMAGGPMTASGPLRSFPARWGPHLPGRRSARRRLVYYASRDGWLPADGVPLVEQVARGGAESAILPEAGCRQPVLDSVRNGRSCRWHCSQ